MSLVILNPMRAILALVTLSAIGWQLALHVGASYSALNFFSYFTNLSNLFAVFVLLGNLISKTNGSRDVTRYISAVNMAVVGLVFAVLLRNADLGALLPWFNAVLHYVTPVAIVADWLAAPPTQKLPLRLTFSTLIFPAFYLAYTLVRGARTGWYPYPFLNPANAGGYGAVATYSVAITGTFVLVSVVMLLAGNGLAKIRSSNNV